MNTSQKHGYAYCRENNSGLSTFKKITMVFAAGLLLAGSVLTAASDSKIAVITDGSNTYKVTTAETDTSNIIEEAGLELSFYDEAYITEESNERIDINIKRAYPVKVEADGGARFLYVTGGTVADVLAKTDIDVSVNDFVSPAFESETSADMVIEVKRGVKIYTECCGERELVYVPEGTVSDALKDISCELTETGNDNIELKAPVTNGMELKVNKIFERVVYVQEKLEPTVIEEACKYLPKGETQIKQEGSQGVIEISYNERYINGIRTEKTENGKQVIRKPVDRILLVGTKEQKEDKIESKPVIIEENSDSDTSSEDNSVFAQFGSTDTGSETVTAVADASTDESSFGKTEDTSGNDFSYSKLIIGTCTAYYEIDGITATGTAPKVGTVAVNPNVIPYGSRLYICSADGSFVYGYCIAEDTGGACMAGDIVVDLYMNSEEECNAFGRQDLLIYILD
ncbi:MAG: 3D domain-containing protein [Acutalibacteraceae bacterium]|nr:3D domain-containing protein [Acutalibacteraceae bacterium]